jgi:hypothetical protein
VLKGFIDGVVGMVKLFGTKPSFFKILSTVLTALPGLIGLAIDFKSADARTKADEFLAGLDAYTGTDAGAVKVFPHMPPEREEEFWDSVKTMARNYIYEELRVDGYYVA